MRKQRQIYFFLPNFAIGGAGNSILNICKVIKRADRTINVISIGKNYYSNKFRDIGVKVLELNNKRTISAIIEIYFFLKKISKQNDIIFISNINYANTLSSIFLKNIKNLKLVLIERTPFQELEIYSNILEFIKKKAIYYLARISYKRADYVIGNSKSVSSYIESKINIKVKTIYPIIKIKSFSKRNYNKILNISWIGRDSKEKNLLDFLKCINLLGKENLNVNIVTDINIKKKIKEIVSEDVIKKIKLFKFTSDKKFLSKIYLNTDIYVNTSIYEGFPNTIAEAINYECLVIASKSFGGCRELIKNNNYGFIYENDYHKLYKCMRYAIKNFNICKKKIKIAKNELVKKAKYNNNKYIYFFNQI